jgi:hypothetical protein
MTMLDQLTNNGTLWRRFSAIAAAVVLLGMSTAPAALATSATATATLTGGSLAFVSAPPSVSVSVTLNGHDQTQPALQALDVGDATGSGTGWNLTATSTTFTTAGSKTLPTSATTIPLAPTVACDAAATCTAAVPVPVWSSYSLPAAASAPTATKMFDAGANTGMGNQTISATWQLAVPGNAYAGTYTSTWTLSLVSGP